MEIRPIRTDSDHKRTLAEIENLWGAAAGTPEGDRLDILVTLVEVYEERRWPLRSRRRFDPVDVLRIPPISMDRSSMTLDVPNVLTAPGVSATRSKKLRALSGSSSIVRLSMVVPSAAVLVCNCGVTSATSTVSLIEPSCMDTSVRT